MLFRSVATLLVPETNVGGYVNTSWDLVSNLIGAIAAAIWLRQSAFCLPAMKDIQHSDRIA